MCFADAPCDQLRVLRTEVDDENGIERIRSLMMGHSLRIGIPDPLTLAPALIHRPMPTPCARWSALPSVCSDGATMTSAFWNSLSVS